MLAQGRPGLLAVDDVFVAHALGAGLDAGEVRGEPGSLYPLAPPDFAAGDAGQKRFCCSALPKAMITGATMTGPKG